MNHHKSPQCAGSKHDSRRYGAEPEEPFRHPESGQPELPRNRLEMPLVGNLRRTVLLNEAGSHRDVCDVKTWNAHDLSEIKLRSIALPRDSL